MLHSVTARTPLFAPRLPDQNHASAYPILATTCFEVASEQRPSFGMSIADSNVPLQESSQAIGDCIAYNIYTQFWEARRVTTESVIILNAPSHEDSPLILIGNFLLADCTEGRSQKH